MYDSLVRCIKTRARDALVVDLLFINWWPPRLLIPRHSALLIEASIFIGHWDYFARVRTFLPADTHRVLWNPQHRGGAGDGRIVERVALSFRVIVDVGKAMGHKTAHRVVVGILLRVKELGDEVGLLVWCWWKSTASVWVVSAVNSRAVGGLDVFSIRCVVAIGITVLKGQ